MTLKLPSKGASSPGASARVAIIDKNPLRRDELVSAISGYYLLELYDDVPRALAEMRASPPALVLVDDRTPERGIWHFVRTLHEDPVLRQVGIIVTVGSGISPAWLKTIGIDGVLSKPYRRSALFRAISAALNRKVEESWQELPPLQRDALEQTLAAFNQLSEVIGQGRPVDFTTVSEACGPLVDAVNSNNFRGILAGVKDHDNYSYAHSLRVATLLSLFGHAIRLPKDEQLILASGGLLHDVGKISIPLEVLNKPGRLSAEEWDVMRGHVHASLDYLNSCESLPKGVRIIAAQHHEKLDGTGYPLGLQGSQLNTLARMAAIVDVFSALTDRRIYKPSLPAEKALAIMSGEMTRHLDQGMLTTFRKVLLDTGGTLPETTGYQPAPARMARRKYTKKL